MTAIELLALRLTLRHGSLPLLFADTQLRSLQRRGLLDEAAHLTELGRELARSDAAQHVHLCVQCKTGAVVTDWIVPRGEEMCDKCRVRERAELREAGRLQPARAQIEAGEVIRFAG